MLSRMATWYRLRRLLAFASLVVQVSEGGEGELLQVHELVSRVVSNFARSEQGLHPTELLVFYKFKVDGFKREACSMIYQAMIIHMIHMGSLHNILSK
jgi:hypothetical protein